MKVTNIHPNVIETDNRDSVILKQHTFIPTKSFIL